MMRKRRRLSGRSFRLNGVQTHFAGCVSVGSEWAVQGREGGDWCEMADECRAQIGPPVPCIVVYFMRVTDLPRNLKCECINMVPYTTSKSHNALQKKRSTDVHLFLEQGSEIEYWRVFLRLGMWGGVIMV